MKNDIVMSKGAFTVALPRVPGLTSIERADRKMSIHGNPAKLASVWTLFDTQSEQCVSIADDGAAVRYEVKATDSGARWEAGITVGSDVVRAAVCADVTDGCVRYTLEDVRETERYHLVTLRLNGLASAEQRDPAARLALPSHGGRLIDPARCADGQTDHRYNWILDSFGSAAVVSTTEMSAVVRIHLMDDQLTSMVGGSDGARYAQVGALLRRRYTIEDASYRRAKPDRDPANTEDMAELPIERDFLLDSTPCVTVEFIQHEAEAPECAWTHGAALVRDALPGKRTDYYKGKMVYKIFVGAPSIPVQTDLEQIRSLVRDVAARTGNAGQLPYLVGFQHKGHDDAYPDVFTLNPALQSVQKLGELVREAEDFNCHISFHDNYDDAYATSPSWSADDISRDNLGHLLRGGVWNGVQAYWNSMPYYAANKAETRIRRTVESYPFLKDTYHLDVLTASVFRIDFRKGEPTGRQRDLKGRLEIVDRFRAHGLDVTSEACGLPFVGHISYFWHMQRVPRTLYQGDERIPMVTFLVHGKADYAGTHTDSLHSILDGLLYGGFYCNDVTAATPVKELTDAYFMLQAPLDLLRDDLAVGYREENGWKEVRYASGATVRVNFETDECLVTIGGTRMIENGTAMIPCANGDTLLYRSHEEPYDDVRWQSGRPAGTVLRAAPLGVDLPELTLTVGDDGCVPVDFPVGVAYRVKGGEN